MAKDANITRVDELRYFASYMMDFGVSMTQNANAFINMMQLRQDDLKRKVEEAENIIKELERIEHEYFLDYCECKDIKEREALSNAHSEANQKASDARYFLSTMQSMMHIVNTNVYAMLENTRTMQRHVKNSVEAGHHFIRNCAAQLDNYVESAPK